MGFVYVEEFGWGTEYIHLSDGIVISEDVL